MEHLVGELKKLAQDVTDEELKDVATVSAGGNDKVTIAAMPCSSCLSRRCLNGMGRAYGSLMWPPCRPAATTKCVCCARCGCADWLCPAVRYMLRCASSGCTATKSALCGCKQRRVGPSGTALFASRQPTNPAALLFLFAPQIGQLISDAMQRVGRAGVVTMEVRVFVLTP